MKQITYEDITIVYEDNHIIVVSKPQNIPSCPDETGDTDMLTLVKDYLIHKYDKPGNAFVGLVHRLDRPTGGAMVFAKTSKSASRLCETIKLGDMEKRYMAVLLGTPREKQVDGLTNYLMKDSARNMVLVVPMATEGAKKAVLDYRIIDNNDKLSLVNVNLHTGRSHQIRVQLANLGTPVFGDQKYGEGKTPIGFNLALWATELKFTHPVTKERMVFRVYPPVDDTPWRFFDINRFLAISIKNN